MLPTPTIQELLPDVRLDQAGVEGGTLRLHGTSTAPASRCPDCGAPSAAVHSHYRRTLQDLPCLGLRVTLRLTVRRFRCREGPCPRRVFTERLPGFVSPYARRTDRLLLLLQRLGLHVGGRPGVPLTEAFAAPAAKDALLRSLARVVPPEVRVPDAIGVDEFALRRGHTYGTVIVDLRSGRPLELLPDRRAESLGAWLRQYPHVAFVARDRSGEYARAITLGAPQATQVLDRWHLLKNLREAVERLVNRNAGLLGGAAEQARAACWPGPSPRARKEREKQRVSLARRQRRHAEIHRLRDEGWFIHHIAEHLRTSRDTVRRALRADRPPQARRQPRQPSGLDAFEPYLLRRWAEGCRNALGLWRELRERGYGGSRTTVMRWAQVRRAPHERRHKLPPEERQAAAAALTVSMREVAWWLVTDDERLSPVARLVVAALCARSPEMASARRLALLFVSGLKERRPEVVEQWFSAVAAGGPRELRLFAAGLRPDRDALVAAFAHAWSNGPTEGAVTRIKLVKRMMFGRGSFALLRKRVLLAA